MTESSNFHFGAYREPHAWCDCGCAFDCEWTSEGDLIRFFGVGETGATVISRDVCWYIGECVCFCIRIWVVSQIFNLSHFYGTDFFVLPASLYV